MKIIVDTNIVFSAILNSQSKIGQLIIYGSKFFDFYSVNLLKSEILDHKNKLLKHSGMDDAQFERAYEIITDRITFIDEILISDKDIDIAIDLVSETDEDDALFVALANHMESQLWSGDKKLMNGLLTKGYKRLISTENLYSVFLQKELESLRAHE
ncbi:PIN domain-containing protein [Aquiflexum sp. LQ15W]|uniref:PIN domain-containing protein n=1 Tax=Cognataquiflexum nitidum TaxID=2922272 RepID=UPI001F12B8BD|nr:PIN domain-containing protein [Cognataquiflexum nitidum]MCH6201911.1 PIN domain-containing protein [Cognataquiflexum nitidum]